MINPASIIAKIETDLGGVEQFNANLVAAVSLIEGTLGPGTASTQLQAVTTAFTAFNANIDAAKAFVAAFQAPFALLVQVVSQLKALGQVKISAVAPVVK
jgi:hypothetical protein